MAVKSNGLQWNPFVGMRSGPPLRPSIWATHPAKRRPSAWRDVFWCDANGLGLFYVDYDDWWTWEMHHFQLLSFALYSDKHVPPLSWCVVFETGSTPAIPGQAQHSPRLSVGMRVFGWAFFLALVGSMLMTKLEHLLQIVGFCWLNARSFVAIVESRVGYTYCRSCPLYLFFSILHHTAPNFTHVPPAVGL